MFVVILEIGNTYYLMRWVLIPLDNTNVWTFWSVGMIIVANWVLM